MRLVAFLFFLIGAAVPLPAQTLERAWPFRTTTSPRVVKAFEEEKIPHLVIKDLTRLQAIERVREIWAKAHPEYPFPVYVAVYKNVEPPPAGPPNISAPNIPVLESIPGSAEISPLFDPKNISGSIDLKNVTYFEAIDRIASLWGGLMYSRNGAVVLLEIQGWDQMPTHEFRLTRRQVEELGLEALSDEEDKGAKTALRRLGFVIEGNMGAVFIPQKRLLQFRAYPHVTNRLETILYNFKMRPRPAPAAR